MTKMTLTDAAARINSAADLSAQVRGQKIEVSRFGRPAGYVTADDLDRIGHTPTGWGSNLAKGKLQVWQALTQEV